MGEPLSGPQGGNGASMHGVGPLPDAGGEERQKKPSGSGEKRRENGRVKRKAPPGTGPSLAEFSVSGGKQSQIRKSRGSAVAFSLLGRKCGRRPRAPAAWRGFAGET